MSKLLVLMPGCCYCWNEPTLWRCSPPQKIVKLWEWPLHPIPRKAQKAFRKWLTSENDSLEALRYSPMRNTGPEWSAANNGLWLYQNAGIGKGWPLSNSPGLNPLINPQSETTSFQDCVLPLTDCAVSSSECSQLWLLQLSPTKQRWNSSPEQALEVPRCWGWDLRTETPGVLNNTCKLCSTASMLNVRRQIS